MKRPITAGVALIIGKYVYYSGNVSVVSFGRVAHSMVRRNAWVMPSFSIESCSVEIDASRRTRIIYIYIVALGASRACLFSFFSVLKSVFRNTFYRERNWRSFY